MYITLKIKANLKFYVTNKKKTYDKYQKLYRFKQMSKL